MARRGRGSRGGGGGGGSVRVTGLERLQGQIDELPEHVRVGLTRAVRESAEAIQGDTQANVRVDEGSLRAGVEIQYSQEGLIADVGWFDRRLFYAVFHEFGTRRFSAQPALGPALDRERRNHRARLTAEVRRALR